MRSRKIRLSDVNAKVISWIYLPVCYLHVCSIENFALILIEWTSVLYMVSEAFDEHIASKGWPSLTPRRVLLSTDRMNGQIGSNVSRDFGWRRNLLKRVAKFRSVH